MENKELSEKIRNRLLEDDVTVGDFFKIDGGDDWLSVPSLNEVTLNIWYDLKDICGDYEPSIVKDMLEDIGDEIAERLCYMPVKEDERCFVSEIAEQEHVSKTTVKIYKFITGFGVVYSIACDLVDWYIFWNNYGIYQHDEADTDSVYIYNCIKDIIDKADVRKELVVPILKSTEKLVCERVGKMKLKDLLK